MTLIATKIPDDVLEQAILERLRTHAATKGFTWYGSDNSDPLEPFYPYGELLPLIGTPRDTYTSSGEEYLVQLRLADRLPALRPGQTGSGGTPRLAELATAALEALASAPLTLEGHWVLGMQRDPSPRSSTRRLVQHDVIHETVLRLRAWTQYNPAA